MARAWSSSPMRQRWTPSTSRCGHCSRAEFIAHCRSDDEAHVVARSPVVLAEAAMPRCRTAHPGQSRRGLAGGFERFERLIDIVSSDEADKLAGRARWRHYKDRGYAIRTHLSRERGLMPDASTQRTPPRFVPTLTTVLEAAAGRPRRIAESGGACRRRASQRASPRDAVALSPEVAAVGGRGLPARRAIAAPRAAARRPVAGRAIERCGVSCRSATTRRDDPGSARRNRGRFACFGDRSAGPRTFGKHRVYASFRP